MPAIFYKPAGHITALSHEPHNYTMFYVEVGDVQASLDKAAERGNPKLPADMRARFVHIARLIEQFGIERVREPHVKHLRGSLVPPDAPLGNNLARLSEWIAVSADGHRRADRSRRSSVSRIWRPQRDVAAL